MPNPNDLMRRQAHASALEELAASLRLMTGVMEASPDVLQLDEVALGTANPFPQSLRARAARMLEALRPVAAALGPIMAQVGGEVQASLRNLARLHALCEDTELRGLVYPVKTTEFLSSGRCRQKLSPLLL